MAKAGDDNTLTAMPGARADANAKDWNGIKSLQVPSENGHPGCLEVLSGYCTDVHQVARPSCTGLLTVLFYVKTRTVRMCANYARTRRGNLNKHGQKGPSREHW